MKNSAHLGPKVIALYLPQYHPIPENDEWWEPGFTEWTNVTKAEPLFPGHHQPNLPADLGFYDLRVPETRESQATIAQQYGVHGFCYYHYWFGNGRRILERPFDEVLSSNKPDFPFMLCWANGTWSGIWHGLENRVLIDQQYPGARDHEKHFELLHRAFQDPRYIRVNNKPAFMVYRPLDIPNVFEVTQLWRRIAKQAGLDGLYLLAEHRDPFFDAKACGFDAFVNQRTFLRRQDWLPWSKSFQKTRNKLLDWMHRPTVHEYINLIDHFVPKKASADAIPCAVPNWDNTPRSGPKGVVINNSTPKLFSEMIEQALDRVDARGAEDNFLFIKSWNEWAEGNYLEPDRRHGRDYLRALRDTLLRHYKNFT